MPYDIFEHRHRFSAWAAARAAQVRSGITVRDPVQALEKCGIVEFLKDHESLQLGQAQFNDLHRTWCKSVMSSFVTNGNTHITFGRAAKLIAVHLKSMVVLNADSCELARVAHPPIDSIMLQNLARSTHAESSYKQRWESIKWTQLEEDEYYQLVSELVTCIEPDSPLWHLEKYWTITR